jgi:hypothetical protein
MDTITLMKVLTCVCQAMSVPSGQCPDPPTIHYRDVANLAPEMHRDGVIHAYYVPAAKAIVFGKGKEKYLAHELTHHIQSVTYKSLSAMTASPMYRASIEAEAWRIQSICYKGD